MIAPANIGFIIISAWVLIAAIYVVTTRYIVRAAYMLLAALFGIAVLYVILNADFLAVTQVLIYVGGVNILIIFGVMLTEHMGKTSFTTVSLNVFPALMVALLIGSALIMSLMTYPWEGSEAASAPTAALIGEKFLTSYVLPFEVASVLLLVVLVGAVAVARKEVK